MQRSTITANPVNIHVRISKITESSWRVASSLIAFPPLVRPAPKNIIFMFDCSKSMGSHSRLKRVKKAASDLLLKLDVNDTFSIVSFNDDARVLMKHKQISENEIQVAQNAIHKMQATGNTNFIAAFKALVEHAIIPPNISSTIIFFTDVEGVGCTADQILKLLPNRKLLHIVPIGVCIKDKDARVLNGLAKLNNESGRPILLSDSNPNAYQEAFNTALARTIEHSHSAVQFAMSIQAKNNTSATKLDIERELPPLCYNGQPTTADVYLDSSAPPCHLKLSFQCDNGSLHAGYTFSVEEYGRLEQGQTLDIKIPRFKWKNSTFYSWIIPLGAIVIGSLLLTGVTVFALSTPMINPLLWKPLILSILASLGGCALLIGGIIAVARKTFFLPTKFAADAAQPSLRQAPRFFAPSSGKIASCLLAASGATAGYFGGTVAAAANAVVATGISPSLFITSCAIGSALALPLLVYGCMQLCAHSIPVAQPLRQ